jgi:hypothetical protein
MALYKMTSSPSWASPIRLLVALCFLLAAVPSPGICIEPDGASHVASADHLCCDPPPGDPGPSADALEDGVSVSLHECAHAALGQPSGAPAKPGHDRAGSPVPHAAALDANPFPETAAIRLDLSLFRPPGLTLLSSVHLRL